MIKIRVGGIGGSIFLTDASLRLACPLWDRGTDWWRRWRSLYGDRIVLRIFAESFSGKQLWQVKGPRPLHPLRIPVQGGPVAAAMALVRVEGRTAPSNATYVWTQPRTLSSACVATFSVGRVYISGWRLDLTDKYVQFAKRESAGTRSSHSMAEAALDSRIPERRLLLVLKARGQSQKIEGDFKDLDLEMVAFRCLLELEHFHLGYLPQHLT